MRLTALQESDIAVTAPAGPVTAVLRAIRIVADNAYEIHGREVGVERVPRALPGHPAHADPLVEQLRSDLYRLAYAADIESEPRAEEEWNEGEAAAATSLIASLSAANCTTDRWDRGWTVRAVMTDGSIVAHKGDSVRVLVPGEFHAAGMRGARVAPDTPVSARVERESLTQQPGFYFAFGDELGDAADEQAPLRFYWNVGADAVPALVERLTERLNRFHVPFRMKCPIHPRAYDRIDSAVLYVARRHYEIVSALVAGVHAALEDRLDAGWPLFTLRLARGLALAEDPGTSESFGTHRCRLLAEALVEAHRSGETEDSDRLSRLVAVFERNGLDARRPWLGHRSTREYVFPPPGFASR